MHVIAKAALVAFWSRYPDAAKPLQAWYRIIRGSDFDNFNKLRTVFPGADYMNGLTVFNIGGNKYRLIAAIHYNRRKIYVRAILTHGEYDRNKWKRGT